MDNLEKLATLGTQDTKAKKTKTTTQLVLVTMETNTYNVNKKWGLLQTNGGKDEANIVFMRTRQHGTKNVKISSWIELKYGLHIERRQWTNLTPSEHFIRAR
jgi:hypothetical protein